MAEPTTGVVAGSEDQPALVAWFDRNRRPVTWGAAVVVVILLGGWLVRESGQRKAAAGADAMDRARGAFESGNLPAASAEFQRIAASFRGTDAGYEAVLALNEVRLASGQHQLAADELLTFVNSGPPASFAAGGYALLGAARENLGRFDEAAAAYASAAERAPEDYRKVDAMLGQARSLRLAGKAPEALTVLRGIVSRFDAETPGVAEAKVRLAELTKGAM